MGIEIVGHVTDEFRFEPDEGPEQVTTVEAVPRIAEGTPTQEDVAFGRKPE